jgi:hypothetical protein
MFNNRLPFDGSYRNGEEPVIVRVGGAAPLRASLPKSELSAPRLLLRLELLSVLIPAVIIEK